MHGNGFGDIFGVILAKILLSIYNCIYRPDGMIDIFLEYDEQIWSTFSGSFFWSLYSAVRVIGIGLLVVSCLISLMDKISDGDFTIENLFRHLLKFFMLYFILLNVMTIFKWLLNLSDATVTEITGIANAQLGFEGSPVNQTYLANSISKNIGIVSKIAYFLLSIIPYFVSVFYTIIMGFFASSRLIEIVVRLAMSPIIIGVSGLSHGRRVDAIRFLKHTAGILFQIVVIVVISFSITVTHNAMASASEQVIQKNPASELIVEGGTREIDIENNGNWQEAVSIDAYLTGSQKLAYTKDSTTEFINNILDIDEYIVGVALMVSAIFMVFKSRDISTKLFY